MSSSPDTGSAQRRQMPTQGALTVPSTSIPPSKGCSVTSTSASAPAGTTLRPGSMPTSSRGPASATSPWRTSWADWPEAAQPSHVHDEGVRVAGHQDWS